MTLTEAIAHLDESLKDKNHEWACEECKEEHIQLKNWLEELSQRRLAHYECKGSLINAYMYFKDSVESAFRQFNYENESIIKGENRK